MSHFWVAQEKSGSTTWAIAPLEGSQAFELNQDGELRTAKPGKHRDSSGAALIRPGEIGGSEIWVLVSAPGGRILANGAPVAAGLKVLVDRDEIRLAGSARRFFYSTERLARVETFPGSEQPVFCQRCKLEISTGSSVVRCPQPRCRLLHHQTEELSCWTYAEHCAMCDQPTALDAGYRWTPEVL